MEKLAAQTQHTAYCIKAIAHPVRLSILMALSEHEKNVQELTQTIGTTQSNISQHLFQMKARDVLIARREGNMTYYSIRNSKVIKLVELMKEIFCNQ